MNTARVILTILLVGVNCVSVIGWINADNRNLVTLRHLIELREQYVELQNANRELVEADTNLKLFTPSCECK